MKDAQPKEPHPQIIKDIGSDAISNIQSQLKQDSASIAESQTKVDQLSNELKKLTEKVLDVEKLAATPQHVDNEKQINLEEMDKPVSELSLRVDKAFSAINNILSKLKGCPSNDDIVVLNSKYSLAFEKLKAKADAKDVDEIVMLYSKYIIRKNRIIH
jgi:uncharacterized coiled-coil protein SlyX